MLEVLRKLQQNIIIKSKIAKNIKRMHFELRGDAIIYCLGDSHIKIFNEVEKYNKLKRTHFITHPVGGATAMGMGNPNSKTNAYKILIEKSDMIKRKHTILVSLGEVDCGFVIWYRKSKYKSSVKKQLIRALTRYQKFIKKLNIMGFVNIIVFSAPPPTIIDGRSEGIVANQRKQINISLETRTRLTQEFNSEMNKFCKKYGFLYLDLTSELLNDNGIVGSKYLNDDVYDHHLNNRKVLPVLNRKLNLLGFS